MSSRTQEKIKNYSKDSKASFEYTKRAGELSLIGLVALALLAISHDFKRPRK